MRRDGHMCRHSFVRRTGAHLCRSIHLRRVNHLFGHLNMPGNLNVLGLGDLHSNKDLCGDLHLSR